MTDLHTYSYIVVDTQRGCHTLKKIKKALNVVVGPYSETIESILFL